MSKPILYLYRGERTWMLCEDIPEEEGQRSSPFTATPVLREVAVETALPIVQAELPGYEVRILNWHRPKRDYSPPT